MLASSLASQLLQENHHSKNGLQPLHRHRPCSPLHSWLSVNTRLAALAAIGLVDKTAFGLAAGTWLATRPGHATGTAGHLNLDLVCRVIARHGQLDRRARRTGLAITAIAAIGTATRLAPGATRCLTVGPVEADEPWRTRATASIHP
ncbi:hypothetical protein D3C76_1302650 [compost metagenome]